jgi:hypothetical protein
LNIADATEIAFLDEREEQIAREPLVAVFESLECRPDPHAETFKLACPKTAATGATLEETPA